ncbi:P-loop containing nucleoside triphosphate hydrolase protein, partial [Phlebopus sp. FC_14]
MALQQILKDEQAQWRSDEQKEAVLAVMERKTDIIAMLKTGGGKSMLPIIAAMLEPQHAVVVVLPLKSLMTDWRRKLTGMGISHQVYNPSVNGGQLQMDINLILVSADMATFGSWQKSLGELNEVLPVKRLVFDEAHLPLLSDFRASLQNVRELRQLAMQIVALSGTVPRSSLAAIKEMFGLVGNAREIRECSNRPELAYRLEERTSSHMIGAKVKQIVEEQRITWETRDRGLIFVTYLEDGKQLAAETGWPFYNGDRAVTDEERIIAYETWRAGRSAVMICTSAFSTGNDYAHVRLIIHYKAPLEMIELLQGQGRAGRDGLLSRCFI